MLELPGVVGIVEIFCIIKLVVVGLVEPDEKKVIVIGLPLVTIPVEVKVDVGLVDDEGFLEGLIIDDVVPWLHGVFVVLLGTGLVGFGLLWGISPLSSSSSSDSLLCRWHVLKRFPKFLTRIFIISGHKSLYLSSRLILLMSCN